jgi:hypothetical protein
MQGFTQIDQSKYKIVDASSTNSLYWIQLAGMAMSIITAIWTLLLLLGNWGSLITLIITPTIHSVITFSFCVVFILYVVALLVFSVLNVVLANGRSVLKNGRNEMLIIFSSITLVLIIELIYVLIWGIKALAVSVNLSIIITVLYPIVTSILFIYSLYYLTEEGTFIPITQEDVKH